jgi:hypothetical protein
MKRMVICINVILISSAWLLIAGCNGNGKGIKATVEGGGTFPEHLAGTWKTEGQSPWVISLAPDGRLLWAIISMGQTKIEPGQTTKDEMIDGQFSTVKAGQCPVSYDPATRELSITIVIEHLNIKIGNDGFEGSSEDAFYGSVSDDGKTWQPTWFSVFDYGPRFPQDEEDVVGVPLTFEKVADYQKGK